MRRSTFGEKIMKLIKLLRIGIYLVSVPIYLFVKAMGSVFIIPVALYYWAINGFHEDRGLMSQMMNDALEAITYIPKIIKAIWND